MADGERDDRAIEDERAANTGAEAKVQHAAAFIAAEGLHAGVVHDADGATERVGVVEADPAIAQVEWFGDRLAMADFAGVADRDALELPIRGSRFHFRNQILGRQLFAGRELGLIGFARLPDLDVGAADIDDQNIHAELYRSESRLRCDRVAKGMPT